MQSAKAGTGRNPQANELVSSKVKGMRKGAGMFKKTRETFRGTQCRHLNSESNKNIPEIIREI